MYVCVYVRMHAPLNGSCSADDLHEDAPAGQEALATGAQDLHGAGTRHSTQEKGRQAKTNKNKNSE